MRVDGDSLVLTTDELACLKRLQAWQARIDKVLALFDPRGVLPRGRLGEARALFTALKRDLKAEYRRGGGPPQSPVTDAEATLYQPTIHEAFVSLQAARSSAPPEKWVGALYDASTDFSNMIAQLRRESQ